MMKRVAFVAVVALFSAGKPASGAATLRVAPQYAAVVDSKFSGKDGDSINGAPQYHSLGAALTGLTANGGPRTVIFIRNGRYREKLTIDRPRITLLGESKNGTILTYDAGADTPSPG